MRNMLSVCLVLVIYFMVGISSGHAQRNRAQYPRYLSQAYFSVNVGYINYPFSNDHLEPGFTAESITVPHTGVRLTLYGWQFNDYFSMKISYMRPVLWVVYEGINGEQSRNTVWMNVAGLTAVPQLPLGERFSLFGEFGLSIVTRKGFERHGETVVRDANYASIMVASGLKYRLNEKFDLKVHGAWTPANKRANQPYTFFMSPGFTYNMRPLPERTVEANSTTSYFFPKNQLQVGVTSNALGYGVNAFFSDGLIPVFWGGSLHVERGLSLTYLRNAFHGHKVFAIDFGASAAYFETEDLRTPFFTLSVFPVLRFTFLRTDPADFFFFYSVAGPTYISKSLIDEVDTGRLFTFHDYMGIGLFGGRDRLLNAEIKIGHYSNGNLFPNNAGVKVPLTLSLGYNF